MSDTPRTDRVILETCPENERDAMRRHARQLEREYDTSHRCRMHADKTVERLERELLVAKHNLRYWRERAESYAAPQLPTGNPKGTAADAAPCEGYRHSANNDLCDSCGLMWSEH